MTETKTFIETQFPVSKLSKESYKERKANHGQTLTGLGKWWGRKPLILVRAAILGLLLPATDSPQKDREVFLRLLTMDEEGLWRRKSKTIVAADAWELATPSERREYFTVAESGKVGFKRSMLPEEREHIQKRIFNRLGYDAKLELCSRPEEIEGPSPESWEIINLHLGTSATTLSALVQQLGEQRFGHKPRVGDAFCGGGSIPFEAARIGCEAFGSDLSPVAALLTWASLNIVGGGEKVAEEVRFALRAVYDAVKSEVETWGIERNSVGWVADAYLYCHEVRDKGWLVPVAPSWVIGERTCTVAKLVPLPAEKGFRIDIHQGVSKSDMIAVGGVARTTTSPGIPGEGTWGEGGVKCPVDADGNYIPAPQRRATSADTLRGSGGLRRWTNDDLVPRDSDVFQERLYCIRWRLPKLADLLWEEQNAVHGGVETPRSLEQIRREIDALLTFMTYAEREEVESLRARDWSTEDADAEEKATEVDRLRALGAKQTTTKSLSDARRAAADARSVVMLRQARAEELASRVPDTQYRAPTTEDDDREKQVLGLLHDRFARWQEAGYIPSSIIEGGYNQDQPMRERGYTHWHHLFNPRQLLTLGLFAETSDAMRFKGVQAVGCLLAQGKLADWCTRLCRWNSNAANEKPEQTFSNQALNTLLNYACRSTYFVSSSWHYDINATETHGGDAKVSDARGDVANCDIWITDPAYADAINYEELGEFFLAWYDKRLGRLFPDWYTTSKRALAVRGSDESFRQAMVECYRNFAKHMPDNGLQIVMFTHTNAEVWADLALILWASGLRVTAAWTIATETDASGLKQGNYVQGTVLLVLRKQAGGEWGDLTDIFPEVQREVERQLEAMNSLDDKDDPNFSDSDYQLAAYAAALRVITSYKEIGDIDVEREIRRTRGRNDKSPLTDVIEKAVKIASDYLVPRSFNKLVWRTLTPDERLYIKGVEVEAHGDYRNGVYTEFARGYGVRDYRPLLGSNDANKTRLKTPTEFKASALLGEGFASSLLRQVLFAIYKTAEKDDPNEGRKWFRSEVPNYWDRREAIVVLLRYLARTPTPAMTHWEVDRAASELLAGLIENDTP